MITINDKPLSEVNVKIEVNSQDLSQFAQEVVLKTLEASENYQTQSAPEAETYLTREQVAEMLQVSLTTLWHWDNKKILKPYRIGNKVRYKSSEIEKSLISINEEEE